MAAAICGQVSADLVRVTGAVAQCGASSSAAVEHLLRLHAEVQGLRRLDVPPLLAAIRERAPEPELSQGIAQLKAEVASLGAQLARRPEAPAPPASG